MRALVIAVFATACMPAVQQRFPDDVQASLASSAMMKLETARFIIYYPRGKRDEVDRFLEHAEMCASELQRDAVITLAEKIVIAMPDTPFDNAFVLPPVEGYEAISVIPLHHTLDFTTEFGLPPDPAYIACHELTHYVHGGQIAGVWATLNHVLGYVWTPQAAYDPWFLEGLATHYEAALQPGVGRPRWPIFTGMFAAAYAGERLDGGEMNSLGRRASVGQHYLVGTMFIKYLTETYGEHALWVAISQQAHDITGLFFTGSFKDGYGKSFGTLFDEFVAWTRTTYPVRVPPANQRHVGTAGNDARYARGADGTEAWVGDDVDLPARLIVRDARGVVIETRSLVEVVPPRTLVQADPLLVSGLSISNDGDVWLTVVDQGTTYNVTRLVRWHKGELREMATELGPGGAIAPRGDVYYYCAVDGDRWSLAAWDVARGTKRVVREMAPGRYVLGVQVSRDGTQLAANVWDGRAFVVWIIDAATGRVAREIRGDGTPIYDASFTSDGRVMYLSEIAGRFQAMIDGVALTDAPYAVLAPREANGTVRFLDREKWLWEIAEVPLRATPSVAERAPLPEAEVPWLDIPILLDRPYCVWDRFFVPQLHSPTILYESSTKPHYGFVLGGGDRLGFQRWNIAGYVQPPVDGSPTHGGATVDYLNTMVAPWQILADASLIDWADPIANDAPEERRTRDVSLTLARTWRGSLLTSLAGVYTEDFDTIDGETNHTHLGGPSLTLSWLSGESTRYTDIRRGIAVSTSVAYYTAQLSSFASGVGDVGGSVTGIVPLSRRTVVSVSARGRRISGAPGLLQLGGDSGIPLLYTGSSKPESPDLEFPLLPPNLRFVESLRGYEDFGIATDRVAIVDASLRYPFIIDRGVAATLWWLPASFISQVDFELFGAGALDGDHRQHAAAGVALTLHIDFLRVPLVVQYQVARRLRDDDAITQLVALGPDF